MMVASNYTYVKLYSMNMIKFKWKTQTMDHKAFFLQYIVKNVCNENITS